MSAISGLSTKIIKEVSIALKHLADNATGDVVTDADVAQLSEEDQVALRRFIVPPSRVPTPPKPPVPPKPSKSK